MKRFRWVILILLLIATWIATEWLMYRRTVPPSNVSNVDSFLKWRPSTQHFMILASDNRHLMATGAPSGLLPSGSSAYIFDDLGKLVDWSADIGDDPKFDEKWQAQHSLRSAKTVTRAEVSSWLTPATRPAE